MTYNPIPVHNNLDGSAHGVVLERDGAVFTGTVDCFVISLWQYGFGNDMFFQITDNPGFPGNYIQIRPRHKSFGSDLVVGAGKSTGSILSVDYTGLPDSECPCNFLISVQLSTSTIQVYVNDQAVSGSPTWNAPTVLSFVGPSTVTEWGDISAPFTFNCTGYVSDFWFGSRLTFCDLSVTANRRKFINADLTPVDLGTTGQNPFGSSPEIFQNVLTGGVAADWLTNRGSIGGTFALNQSTITLDGNPCVPNPPTPLLCADPHSQSEITPEWSSVVGATSYSLQYRPALLGGAWTQIDGILTTQVTITGLLPGTQYEWQVEAHTSGGDTGFGTSGFCFTDPSPFMFLACENGWTVTAPVTQIWGFDHLIGMTVVGLADGVQLAPQTVAADGSITLPFPASNIKIGLPFTAQLQLPYLDAGTPTVQGRRKVVTAVTVRVDASNGVQLGTNQIDGSTLKPQAIAPAWPNMQDVPIQSPPSSDPQPLTYTSPGGQTVNFLQTGDLRQVVTSQWAKPGQVAIQQTNPLPLTVLAAMPELLEGDVTEQGFAQEQKPQQHVDHRRQHQGPGAWMLRR